MAQKPSIPKGTRDFTPPEVRKRQYIFSCIQQVFEAYAYQPIETPAYELLETLTGKYGEEGDKLMFKLLPRGEKLSSFKEGKSGIEEALRYDLTVPFARFVVQHQHELVFPFKRYQIQPVWRADKPQKGRYREFYQCDVDVIGSDSLLNEVELIQMIQDVFLKLNIPSVRIKLNNRKLLSALATYMGAPDRMMDITIALDKLDKVGEQKVKEELLKKGLSASVVDKLDDLMKLQGTNEDKLNQLNLMFQGIPEGQKGIQEVQEVLALTGSLGIKNMELDLTLARGLNYYTGAIFEVKSNDFPSSLLGGGRYDDLTGIFGLSGVSGVGVSFGADRIYDLMEQLSLFPSYIQLANQVFFINFGVEEIKAVLPKASLLRKEGVSVEVYPSAAPLKKQFKYADQSKIRWVVVAGTQEMAQDQWKLKDMHSGNEELLSWESLLQKCKSM